MTTAIVGAGIVAVGTGAALPDLPDGTGFATVEASNAYGDLGMDRVTENGERASRGSSRGGPASTVNQAAPNVWLLPMQQYTVTSTYGARWGRLHPGVDLGAPEGTPFFAAAKGTVILARYNGGYGNNIVIDHGNGVVTVYGHASRLLVTEGQVVQAGDRIALCGNTGHSFGAHLHFEVRIDENPTEPLAFMQKRGVDIQKHVDPTAAS